MGISRSLKELLVQHYNMKAFIAIISTLLAAANAEAEAEADPALLYANAYHGLGHYGYGYGLGYYGGYSGYPYYGYNTGVAAHPGAATSHVARSPQGLTVFGRKKRDAEAEPEAVADADAAYYYGGYYGSGYGSPYGYGYGLASPYYGRHYGYGLASPYYHGLKHTGVAAHPGLATSHVARSPQGLGKRSADAEPEADADADAAYYYGGYYGSGYGYPYGYGYGLASPYYGRHFNTGVAAHPGFGTSHTYRSVQGLGK